MIEPVIEPVLMLAPRTFLTDVGRSLREVGIQRAVGNRDAAAIFDWIMAAVPFQGISDAVASTYSDRHGTATWAAIDSGSKSSRDCAKLTSYWAFSGCGYRNLSVAALYCDEVARMRIERDLRARYNPPCGDR